MNYRILSVFMILHIGFAFIEGVTDGAPGITESLTARFSLFWTGVDLFSIPIVDFTIRAPNFVSAAGELLGLLLWNYSFLTNSPLEFMRIPLSALSVLAGIDMARFVANLVRGN